MEDKMDDMKTDALTSILKWGVYGAKAGSVIAGFLTPIMIVFVIGMWLKPR